MGIKVTKSSKAPQGGGKVKAPISSTTHGNMPMKGLGGAKKNPMNKEC